MRLGQWAQQLCVWQLVLLLTIWKTIGSYLQNVWGFPGGAGGKEPACKCRRHKRRGFHPWVRKIRGGGHDNPLQYSCLEDPMDRGAWGATVHGIGKSQTRPKQLSTHTHMFFKVSTNKEGRFCLLTRRVLLLRFSLRLLGKVLAWGLSADGPSVV